MRHNTGICLCAIAVVFVLALTIGGCGGSDDAILPTGTARIIMVDAPPSALQELHVTLTGLHLFRHSGPETIILDENDLPGRIDVLDLADNPLVFEDVSIPSGNYTHARLLIDPDAPGNVLRTADGVEHPWVLDPHGAYNSMTLIGWEFRVEPGENIALLVDFCAAASVYQSPAGAWTLRPIVFFWKLHDPDTTVADLASLQGTVLDRDGRPLQVARNQVLGLIIEMDHRENRRVTVTEIDPATGEFEIPHLPNGRYRVSVRPVDARWETTGPPLPLQTRDGVRDYVVLRIARGEVRQNIMLTMDQ